MKEFKFSDIKFLDESSSSKNLPNSQNDTGIKPTIKKLEILRVFNTATFKFECVSQYFKRLLESSCVEPPVFDLLLSFDILIDNSAHCSNTINTKDIVNMVDKYYEYIWEIACKTEYNPYGIGICPFKKGILKDG